MFFPKRGAGRLVLGALALAVAGLVVGLHHRDAGSAPARAAAANPSGADAGPAMSIVAVSASTRVGASYQLTPKVTGAAGLILTFSATNLPPWARIDAATGQITGTPGTTDIGEYESITIAAADATHRIASSPFSINVIGPPAAHLAWRKPEMRVDGSALDDLAGYRIVYGRNPEDLDRSIFIDDPDQLTYDFNTLEAGAWYFAVIALTANGLEGPATTPAMKMI